MFRIFVVLLFVATSASAQRTMLAQDSPWEQANDHSWMLTINGVSRQEVIYLVTVGDTILFTATRTCMTTGYSEVYTWKHGDMYARGTLCRGERVRIPTRHWESWIHPLPVRVDKKKYIPM